MLDGAKVCVNGIDMSATLSDGSHNSKRYVGAGESISIESEAPFGAFYVEWGSVPGEYEVLWESGSMICGQEGFLHDYVRLPEAVQSLEFVFNDGSAVSVCELQPYTMGQAPDDVQDWLPPCAEADMWVFPIHSDDDALFFGALISYYAIERGLNVQTAFMVEHRGYPGRDHERLNGLWEMGIRNYPILGKACDSETWDKNEAMHIYAPYDICRWQTELIRRFRPLVVVGHDLNGEYGNGGHKVNAHYLTLAVDEAADPEKYPESAGIYGVWDTPKLYLHLYEESQVILDVYTPLTNDVQSRSPFQIAQDAFKHHESQQKWGFRVGGEDKPDYDCRLFGLYRTLVGPDTVNDIMDNIDADSLRPQK